MKLEGKVVWITGASSGIGKAVAEVCYQRGARIVLSSRREDALRKVADGFKDQNRVRILPLDLMKLDELADKAESAWRFFDGVDCIIHSGGRSLRATVVETQMKVDHEIMNTLYFGNITLTKALLPKMIARKRGHIAVVSSLTGKFGTPLRSSYNAAKHALHGFYDSLRAEVHKDQIRVTLILPGFVKTDVSMNALRGDGSAYGITDPSIEGGYTPEYTAEKIIRAIEREQEEVLIAQPRELSALYLKRFFPSVLSRVIRNVDVR